MKFCDLHIHALYGVDDGPATQEEMFALVDAACADGTGALCLTPHCHPGYFGENRVKAVDAFELLKDWAGEKHPELELYLGNELRWNPECVSWIRDGVCRTLNGTKYLLVDFLRDERERTIVKGLEQLMNMGYIPVLAHVERYNGLSPAAAGDLARNGVWMQIDSQAIFGDYGLGAAHRAKAMLKAGLVDLVASDSHDLKRYPPQLSRAFHYIEKKFGRAYADGVCLYNPLSILTGARTEGDKE